MKSSLKYLKLWQKKRSELQIKDDPQSDWLQMHQLLDKHLPVSSPKSTGKSKLFNAAKLKPLLSIPALVVTAVAIYFAAHKGDVKNHKHKQEIRDSVSTESAFKDSVKSDTGDNLYADHSQQPTIKAEADKQAIAHEPARILNIDSSALLNKNIVNDIRKRSEDQSAVISQHNNKPYAPLVDRERKGSGNNSASVSSKRNTSLAATVNSPIFQLRYLTGANGYVIDGESRSGSEEIQGRNSGGYPLLITFDPPKPGSDLRIANSSSGIISFKNNSGLKGTGFSKIKVNRIKTNNKRWGGGGSTAGNYTGLNVDWGVLTGVNSSGSFTSSASLFFGAFATFDIRDKMAFNVQVRAFTPQSVTGSYTIPNDSKIGRMGLNTIYILTINDSRKINSIEVPLYLEYKATDNIRLKAGPVISFPIKQANGNSVLEPDSIRRDTAFYAKTAGLLAKTTYAKQINYGVSGGVSMHLNRFIFEATYLKQLKGQKIISDLGSYTSSNSTFQFTLGFRLNRNRNFIRAGR